MRRWKSSETMWAYRLAPGPAVFAKSRWSARVSLVMWELLGGRGEYLCGSIKLGIWDEFLVKISLAENQDVPERVVVGSGITGNLSCAQFINVAVSVDTDVVGDISPPALTLVVLLVLAAAAAVVDVQTVWRLAERPKASRCSRLD